MKQIIKTIFRKLFYIHIGQTWDGRNKDTITSHDANIVLFNFLRLNPQWRSYDDDSLCLNLWVGIILNDHHQLFYLSITPTFEFSAPLIRRWWKRMIHYRTIRELEQQIEELSETCDNICSDPMCGCPDDFARDFSRQINHLEYQIQQLSY